MSADTGRSVAATMAAAAAITSSRESAPSVRPSAPAEPLLVVASASKPAAASTLAEPGSHGFGISNGCPGTCSSRNRRALSDWETLTRPDSTTECFVSGSGSWPDVRPRT